MNKGYFEYLLCRLTISTLASVTPNMRLIDVNGAPHVLTEYQVRMIITIGWLTFLAAWLMNLLNYEVHPSSVIFSPTEKMFLYIFGTKYDLRCILRRSRRCSKGESKFSSLFLFKFFFCPEHPKATIKILIWEKKSLWKLMD